MRALLLALALVLLIAAPAYAGSADSAITTPSGTVYLIDNGNDNLVVAGTTTQNVDIVCTYGPNNSRVEIPQAQYPAYYDIPLQPPGNFSAVLPLAPLRYEDCVLRAVPHAYTVTDYSTFTGPTVSVAYRHTDASPFNYQLQLAPLGGSVNFGQSSYYGGIADSYAENSTDLSYQKLFSEADLFMSPPAVDNGRAAVQVDGQDALFQNDVASFADSSPPTPAPTLNFDSATGLGSVSSHEPLGVCSPGGVFPANHTNCHDVSADGVRLDHSAKLIDNGALALVDDQFTSTDGAVHTVDAWVQQGAANFNGIEWQFPADTGFSDYTGVTGRTVPSGPATALLSQNGAGYGSLSWADTPDAVRFSDRATPNFHYRFTVPAGGSHVLRFAYGSSFTAGGAAALGAEAVAMFQPPPAGPGGGAPPIGPPAAPPAPIAPRLKFSAKANGDGSVTVTFQAPGAGTLSGLETAVVPRSAKKKTKKLTVSKAHKRVTKAGTVKLVLKLNKHGRKIFRAKHRLRTTLSVSFKPKVGTASKLKPKHLTLKLKKKHHKHA